MPYEMNSDWESAGNLLSRKKEVYNGRVERVVFTHHY